MYVLNYYSYLEYTSNGLAVENVIVYILKSNTRVYLLQETSE